MTEVPAVVVLAPIRPSATGNGLAMRTDLLVAAAARHHEVHLVVVPVAGATGLEHPTTSPASLQVMPSPAGSTRDGLARLLADPVQRRTLEAMVPLPAAVRQVSPSAVADTVRSQLEGRPVVGVVAGRLALAQAALAVARDLAVPFVLDLDDDDEAFHRAAGDTVAADAWGRVAAALLPHAALVLAAAPAEADALSARHGVPVAVVPNAVRRPERPLGAPPCEGRALMVGNLTYAPNVEGAAWLVEEVLPRLPGRCSVELAGRPSAVVRGLAGPRVAIRGQVADLRPCYEAADVVVVPLRRASGTRLKVLEAMAVGRPVVSTHAGAAGLAVRDGTHLLLADDAPGFAAAIVRAMEPAVAAQLVGPARTLVAETYDAAVVAASAGALLRDAFAP